MRLKIKFELSGKKQVLPLNYQYPISAWIYKVLSKADEEFTNTLHNEGYKLNNGKTFKLFTFSKLNFPIHTWKIIPKSDRMQIWARQAYLTISFQLPEQMEKFVIGLFNEQKVFVGDKISGIEMGVVGVEVIKDVPFDSAQGKEIEDESPASRLRRLKNVRIRTKTPIVLGINIEGEKYEQYVTPLHAEYKALFLNNLLDKYSASGGKDVEIEDLDFEVVTLHKTKKEKPKTDLQVIKAFTKEETRVKGYFYDFKLSAPKKVIEVGLNSGFGSMSSLGFGFCEVLGI